MHTHSYQKRKKNKNMYTQHINDLPISKISYNIFQSMDILLLDNNFVGRD